MAREILRFDELFQGLDAAPRFVAELERLGLLKVVGRDSSGQTLYESESREQLRKVMELVHLGYEPPDIAAIARKMGLVPPKRRLFQRRARLLSRSKLAARAGVPEELLATWENYGILDPHLTTTSGEPLYDAAESERLLVLYDLLSFGWTTEAIADWIRITRELSEMEVRPKQDEPMVEDEAARARLAEMGQVVGELRRRVDALRAGARRWDKLLDGFQKRIGRLEKAHGMAPPAKPATRRRLVNTRKRA
jgi:DNA-binding transcriptional MerR regulator